jgi:hypothetical protein
MNRRVLALGITRHGKEFNMDVYGFIFIAYLSLRKGYHLGLVAWTIVLADTERA